MSAPWNSPDEVTSVETPHGFVFGAAEITRAAIFPSGTVVNVKTACGRSIDIYVSPTGRSLRVFSGNEEWKPVVSRQRRVGP